MRSLTAINRLFGSGAKKFLKEAETVPSKMVFTVKPPSKAGDGFKRECRVVSCGNFAEADPLADNYSSGAQAETVRLVITLAAQLNLKLSVTDVKNAFLRAPLPMSADKVGTKPPAALKKAGYAEEDGSLGSHEGRLRISPESRMVGLSPRWSAEDGKLEGQAHSARLLQADQQQSVEDCRSEGNW